MAMGTEELHVSDLLSRENCYSFVVPSYQREYSWDKKNWSDLFTTIAENEGEDFIGTFIFVPTSDFYNSKSPLRPWEIIDGQQRLTTLSIFFCALYTKYEAFKDQIEENSTESASFDLLKSYITLNSRGKPHPRLILQEENDNNDLYLMLLKTIKLGTVDKNVPYGTRRSIFRAYYFFLDKIDEYIEDSHKVEAIEAKKNNNPIELTKEIYLIDDLFSKTKQLMAIKINVDSRSKAINIFGALNSTGTPLTAVDLIKTDVLKQTNLDKDTITNWSSLIDNIKGPDEKTNDRFFRQYLNAFKYRYAKKYRLQFDPVITSSNVYANYQQLLKVDSNLIVQDLFSSGVNYSYFLTTSVYETKDQPELSNLNEALFDLYKSEGAPSYILLLNLFKRREDYGLSYNQITDVVNFLTKFFVRRNFTDTPPTRDLIRLFISIVETVEDRYYPKKEDPEFIKQPEALIKDIKTELINSCSSLDKFIKVLFGPIYDENKNATRFILSYLTSKNQSNESKDPWSRDEKSKLLWTIEHILPQTDNLSDDWIQMIFSGKPEEVDMDEKNYARYVQAKYLHTIGNLTLTGYNSTLSTRPFLIKRDYKDQKGNPIGFNNGFWLNQKLCSKEVWTEKEIKDRSLELVKSIVNLVKFDDEIVPSIDESNFIDNE